MIPPLMSSTLNADAILGKKDQQNNSKNQNSSEGNTKVTSTQKVSTGEVGRPQKEEGQKSEKTIANQESMS